MVPAGSILAKACNHIADVALHLETPVNASKRAKPERVFFVEDGHWEYPPVWREIFEAQPHRDRKAAGEPCDLGVSGVQREGPRSCDRGKARETKGVAIARRRMCGHRL